MTAAAKVRADAKIYVRGQAVDIKMRSLKLCWLASITALAVCLPVEASAQTTPAGGTKEAPSPLKVSGSVRLRYETVEGQARAGFNTSDDLINLRTRVAADYDAGALRFGGEIYDSRAYGSKPGTPLTTNEVNTLEVVQAYVASDINQPWGPGSKASVQVGRFTLNLGARRLVAADDFRNTTNGYTGIKLDGQWAGGVNATAIYVLPQIRRPDDFTSLSDNEVELDRDTSALKLFGGLVTVPVAPEKAALQVSYFGLDERDQSDLATRDRDLDTYGLRYFREPAADTLDFDVEAFAQRGSLSASVAPGAATLDVSASYLHAEAGYRWSGLWKPRLAFEYEYASGDKPGGDYNRFDTLFGMRRAEIAPAGLYNAVGRANINSPGLRLEVEPSATWDAFIGWKALWLASNTDAFSTTGVRDATGGSGRFAGNQIDARVRYWLVPQTLRLETTVVYLAKGDVLQNAPNALRSGDTIYAAFDVTTIF